MRWSALSIRARITVGSVAIALVLLASALFIVRAQVATTLTDADVSLARSDLTSFEKDITAHPDESVDDPGTGVLVFVRDPESTVEVNTLPHDLVVLIDGRAAADEQFAITDDEGRNFVIVGTVVATSAGDWGLWSARSTSSSELAMRGVERVLVVGGLALLIGFGLASWLLSTIALRPVTAMRRTAEQLNPSDPDGRLPIGRARDELAALAVTLNSFLDRVEESSDREKRMISDAAHELRTPLASLRTQLELSHGDVGDPVAIASHVRAAEQSVDRLVSLASNLLELSRLDAHERPHPESSAARLGDELSASIDRARLLAVSASTQVGFDVGLPHPAALYRVDPQAFGRVCDNLLSNSITALAGRGSVTASLTQNGDHLILEVADDGPGVPAEFVPVAFERFTRPDEGRSSARGGSGLGLALVKAIAEQAGGSVSMRNTEPGLTIEIDIPDVKTHTPAPRSS